MIRLIHAFAAGVGYGVMFAALLWAFGLLEVGARTPTIEQIDPVRMA